MRLSTSEARVVILGAGVGGVSSAIALKKQLGFENFIIYEKASSVGGTWRDNVYPGCSSDVAVHFYQLSTDQKEDWTASHPFQPEICAYWEQLAQKHKLHSHIVFNRNVVSCDWNAKLNLWKITTEDVISGQRESTEAEIVISAIGVLEVPKYPDIAGIAEFKGELFHSARWPKTDLSGKKVAVVGNGASATQFLPIIARTPGIEVTQFVRTPNWLLPPIRVFYSPFHVWCMKYIPFLAVVYRFFSFCKTELFYVAIFKLGFFNTLLSKNFTGYIKANAPPKHREKLIPSYSPGCKRLIFDTDYLSALRQDNVDINWDGISNICSDGIITKQHERLSFDTIILATGYVADRYPLPVNGLNGRSIQEYHDSQGGPTAYVGTTTPGFPNFFILAGPNTATGHTSVIYTEEIQINYALQLIRPVLERTILSIEPTVQATDEWNNKLQQRLARSVFTGCSSWYRVKGTEKISSIFPGSGMLFWWWLRKPDWSHYRITRPSDASKQLY